MGKPRSKFVKGEPITNLDELASQEFVYWHHKLTHNGWFMSWQFRMAYNAIQCKNVIYKAVRQEDK